MTNDFLTNIFKVYTVCSDKVFVKYITHKKEGHEEGIKILPDNMMHRSVQIFKLLKKTNRYNAPSENE